MTETKKAEVLDHVRRPDLPWRVSALTECGRLLGDVQSCISRDQLLARLRDFGQARTSLTTCMTCWQTSRRWETFDVDPVDALRREVYAGRSEPAFGDELRALAALAVEYRDEFDAYLQGLKNTADLTARRATRRPRSARGFGPTSA